jgi:hypothetical protein
MTPEEIKELKEERRDALQTKVEDMLDILLYNIYAKGEDIFRYKLSESTFKYFDSYLDNHPEIVDLFAEVSFNKPSQDGDGLLTIKFKEI